MTRTPMNAEPFILRKATSYLRQGKPTDTGSGAKVQPSKSITAI
jgi:hypothetical protein